MFGLADGLPAQVRQEIPEIPRRVRPAITIEVDHRQAVSLQDELVRAHRAMARNRLGLCKMIHLCDDMLNDFFVFDGQVGFYLGNDRRIFT